MAAQDCIDDILKAAGRDLSDAELDELVTELNRVMQTRKAEGRIESLDDELADAAQEIADEAVFAARIEKRNTMINIVRLQENRQFVRDAGLEDPSLAIEARNVGINTPIPGGRVSVAARSDEMFAKYGGGMIADLRKAELLVIANSRTLDREIARELAELSKAEGVPGISGSKDALGIARIMDKYRKIAVSRENRAGAWIRPLDGYIVRQSHDMNRIRRAGFEQWKEFIAGRLDTEKTFDGADPEKFLQGAYDGVISGRHLKANAGDENDLKFVFKGPGNLAKRVSEHRILHFRDADAWFDYNERFGRGDLMTAFTGDLERAARNTALMETWGTNPRAMFGRVLDELKDKHRGDIKALGRLNRRALENQFREVTGEVNIPIDPSGALVGGMVRALQNATKLGGATLSALADLPFKASELRFQGRGLGQSYNAALFSALEGMTPGDRRITAELIGVGLDGQIGDLSARFSARDELPGTVSKIQRIFFKLNLLTPWTDANKRGIGLLMARDLGMQKAVAFDKLNPRLQSLLPQYDIDAARWDVLRGAVRKEADGREYMMPDAIRDIPDERLTSLIDGRATARRLQVLRDELETSLRSYYTDRAEFAVPTPGAREFATLRQGIRPGTVVGEAVRFMMQFKAFPTTVITKALGRELFGRGARSYRNAIFKGQGDLWGVANIIVGTTIMGYVAQSAKQIAKGRTPRDPDSQATWTAAMLQGGGLGIYGDFLLGEFNRFGRTALETAAGPALGDLADVAQILARIRVGDDTAAQSLRVLKSNLPGANLFYTQAALDYLIFYNLQESINPGYLRRTERRIEKETGSTFILPPSQVFGR